MATQPTLALFQGGPLDGQVARLEVAAEWFCARHAEPVPAELVAILAAQPGPACLAYRRHAGAPGRVVYRFVPTRRAPVSDDCRRLSAEQGVDG